jgi:excisionase family DNA binding protein
MSVQTELFSVGDEAPTTAKRERVVGPERSQERLLLRPEEAAAELRIGRTKLYELMAAGVIESVRIGACRRVPWAAVEDYVARLRASTSSRPRGLSVKRPVPAAD